MQRGGELDLMRIAGIFATPARGTRWRGVGNCGSILISR